VVVSVLLLSAKFCLLILPISSAEDCVTRHLDCKKNRLFNQAKLWYSANGQQQCLRQKRKQEGAQGAALHS
jgi:hypothetical protein